MSRASPASDPASTAAPADTSAITQTTRSPRTNFSSSSSSAAAAAFERRAPASSQNVSAPAPARGQPSSIAAVADSARSTHSLNVLHILNPTSSEASRPGRDPFSTTASATTTTTTTTTTNSPSAPAPGNAYHLGRRAYSSFSEASPDYGRGREADGVQMLAQAAGARRILMPRSPAARAVSLGRLSLPSGALVPPQTIAPPLPGLSHASEVPPLPTPPSAPRFNSSYGFPAVGVSTAGRRASAGPISAPMSQSVSPSTSYSSHVQTGHASPAPPPPPPQPSHSHAQPHAHPHQPPPPPPQPPSLMMPTTTQPAHLPLRTTAYDMGGHTSSAPPTPSPFNLLRASGATLAPGQQQMLTLNTGDGPIEVPLDVQAASKMADDRRKRNAGASARFRQRRKEKEREASQTIARLEQRIRDVAEERDHYRQERDHFQRLVLATPGHPPLGRRPSSPVRRRSVHSNGESSGSGGGGGGGGESSSAVASGEPSSQQRRGSAYAGPSYSLPLPPPPPQPQGPLGAPSAAAAASHGPVPMGFGLPSVSPHDRRPSAPASSDRGGAGQGEHPTADTYDPYASERYDRDWYIHRNPR